MFLLSLHYLHRESTPAAGELAATVQEVAVNSKPQRQTKWLTNNIRSVAVRRRAAEPGGEAAEGFKTPITNPLHMCPTCIPAALQQWIQMWVSGSELT